VIVVDTSALTAILLQEPQAAACKAAIVAESPVLISAGTFVEALIVAGHRNLGVEMTALIDGLDFEIESVTSASARSVSRAYETWGKGLHPAALNFGDCFAYALAQERACPLLYVGGDFKKTDIVAALPGAN
jgi:ribonuclease VapC